MVVPSVIPHLIHPTAFVSPDAVIGDQVEIGPFAVIESGVTIVEWGDKIRPVLPSEQLEIRIEFGEDDDDRVLQIRPEGASWQARRRRLGEALAEWTEGE